MSQTTKSESGAFSFTNPNFSVHEYDDETLELIIFTTLP